MLLTCQTDGLLLGYCFILTQQKQPLLAMSREAAYTDPSQLTATKIKNSVCRALGSGLLTIALQMQHTLWTSAQSINGLSGVSPAASPNNPCIEP
jgi:hypothetical protein